MKLVCSELCNKFVKKTNRAYFLFYYNDPDYRYEIAPADILISSPEEIMIWDDYEIKFFITPAAFCAGTATNDHSYASVGSSRTAKHNLFE